ncbi:hypothetical protein Q0590_09455 [Rhodocytophaga aerolata]|uniref:Uncharacterized protein n=1 Tax=Rhodocytophaga aerolata TaxID=455078 RepID=A0ABT8R2Z7_9BACT|nr:hypothetical protein [Rhodocytophaga aerolata]MDO1446474.1 hypothetical protein [Rhodocytophaga aerolata]
MLDLAKPLGTHEGLIFYGDHELTDLVYYFPDEVSLAPQASPDGNPSEFYELFFQIFNEGDIVEGGIDDLRKTAGAILSLGVQCSVSPARLEKALQQLKGNGAFPETVSATAPPWKDGAVNLLVLDAITSNTNSLGEDAFVKSIVGSQKPSLMSGDLKSLFNVRLDRRGTALIQAALDGDTGNVAGVLYDLKYTAIRPAVDLRIWANLGRCYDSIAHQLGVKAEFTYYVKFSLGAELNWLTKKLEEDGDLKIELLTQVEDPETMKMIDEMVKDFKESILREIFRPYVNPQTVNVTNLDSMVPVVGVSYKFTKEKISHEKVIEVDYRERSTVIRTHNPQSHLWVLGKQIAQNRNKYIQRVIFSDIWREQSLSIKLVHDFNDPKNDLLSAEVIIWRSKHGIVEEVPEGRFSIPATVDPLKNLTFHKGSSQESNIAWLYDRDEPIGYFYQLRFNYNTTIDNISSPAEIITKPVFSTNENLILFPDTYVFFKTIEIREGNISFEEFKSIDVALQLKDADGAIIGIEIITINAENTRETWTIRGKDKSLLFVEASKEYHYHDGRPSVKTEPLFIQDDEIIINKPFQKSTFTLIPVIAGKNEEVSEILLEIRVASPLLNEPIKELHRIKGPAFVAEEIKIKLHSDQDQLTYEAQVITQDGRIIRLDKGELKTNALVIDLKRMDINEVIFIWQGRSPEALGLRNLKVELRAIGEISKELEAIEYTGSQVPLPVKKIFPTTEKVEWRIFKRFENGSREKGEFKPIEDHTVLIVAE